MWCQLDCNIFLFKREGEGRMVTNTGKLLEVQMLRFLAATMVLFGHVQHEITTRPTVAGQGFVEFTPLFWAGGVDVFFVISGFIMYHLSRSEFGGEHASRRFLLRRLARIAPTYWLFTTAMLVAISLFPSQIIHDKIDPLHVASSYAFFPAANPYGRYYPILMLGWTINFEMMFYLVFTLAMYFRRSVGVVLIAGLLLILAGVGFVAKPSVGPFAFWCDPIVIEFLLGILLAHLRANGLRVTGKTSLVLFMAGIASMLLAHYLGYTYGFWSWRPLWMGLPALLICSGPMLMQSTKAPSGLARFLAHGGDASYALYLSHPFAIGLVALAASRVPGLTGWNYFAVAFVVSMAAAFAVYHWIELPLTRLAQSVAQRFQGRKATT